MDNDGRPDIYVPGDSTPSFFFRNNDHGTFSEIGLETGAAVNEDGSEQASMGLGLGDYNLDGHLDIFKTHFADHTRILSATTATFGISFVRDDLDRDTRKNLPAFSRIALYQLLPAKCSQ